jgi:hypothetical protein
LCLLWLHAGGKLVTLFSAPDYPQVSRMLVDVCE